MACSDDQITAGLSVGIPSALLAIGLATAGLSVAVPTAGMTVAATTGTLAVAVPTAGLCVTYDVVVGANIVIFTESGEALLSEAGLDLVTE